MHIIRLEAKESYDVRNILGLKHSTFFFITNNSPLMGPDICSYRTGTD
jgi:hypothetical protein